MAGESVRFNDLAPTTHCVHNSSRMAVGKWGTLSVMLFAALCLCAFVWVLTRPRLPSIQPRSGVTQDSNANKLEAEQKEKELKALREQQAQPKKQ